MANLLPALVLLLSAAGFSHKEQKAACTTCHAATAESTKGPDNSTRFVKKFNHAAHGKMLKCENCHRLQADAANPGFPAMQFCIGCHNKIDLPDSCEKCHLKTQELRPPSHLATAFFDTHSSGKIDTKNAGCAVCHGKFFICQGCH